MKQFEIWWAQLPAPVGPRPVLLLTRDPAYQYLNKFIVAEITTTIRRIPQEVALGRAEGMKKPCVANLDNLRTVAKPWLAKRLGRVAEDRRVEVKRALGAALGWEELALAEN